MRVKDTRREKAPSNKTLMLLKSMNMNIWYIKSNFHTKFLNLNKIFQKMKSLLTKLGSL